MSARKATPRPKARKEKLIEVHGLMLTPEQYAEYRKELVLAPAGVDKGKLVQNILYRARPSVKAQKRFERMDLYGRVVTAAAALGALRDGSLESKDGVLVGLYNGVVGHLAKEFLAVGNELAAMNAEIQKELQS